MDEVVVGIDAPLTRAQQKEDKQRVREARQKAKAIDEENDEKRKDKKSDKKSDEEKKRKKGKARYFPRKK